MRPDNKNRLIKQRDYLLGMAVEISAIIFTMLVAFFLGALLVRF